MEGSKKQTSLIPVYWISLILSQICSILQNMHESITQIPKKNYRNPIPMMAWMPELIELFDELINGVTFSPVCQYLVPIKQILLILVGAWKAWDGFLYSL